MWPHFPLALNTLWNNLTLCLVFVSYIPNTKTRTCLKLKFAQGRVFPLFLFHFIFHLFVLLFRRCFLL